MKPKFFTNNRDLYLPISVSHLAMQPYTSSNIIITTRLIITAVAVTVTLILDRPAGDELIAKAAAVEIR